MPEILDDNAVAEIEVRAERATRGPWTSPANVQPWVDEAAYLTSIITGDGGYINHRNWKEVCANMDFISRARANIPALCQTVRAAKERWEAEHELLVKVVSERNALGEQLVAVTQDRNALLKEVSNSERYQAQMLSCPVSAEGDFRTRAVQLCKEKAIEWRADLNRETAWHEAADEIAGALEHL